jgi:hypothetical protein
MGQKRKGYAEQQQGETKKKKAMPTSEMGGQDSGGLAGRERRSRKPWRSCK